MFFNARPLVRGVGSFAANTKRFMSAGVHHSPEEIRKTISLWQKITVGKSIEDGINTIS